MKTILSLLLLLINTHIFSQVECDYQKKEIDEFTGTKKLVLKPQVLFTHVDSILRKYYPKGDYLKCSGKLASIGGTKVLYLDIRIKSEKAYKYYGSIRQDSKLIFKLSDQSMVTLKTTSEYDSGETNYSNGYTDYSPYYILNNEAIIALKKQSISKLRLYWSEGYEDYPVSNGNYIKDNINCIE